MDCSRFDVEQYLSVLPLFGDLSPAQRLRLVADCELQAFAQGQRVFSVSDPCQAFYVVVTGKVKLFVASPSGQEKVIELITPSQSFAEAFMFLDMACMVNAQTLADSLLLRVGKQVVVGEIQRDPQLAMNMLAGISRRMHGLIRDVEGLTLHNGMQRLIGYLLREIEGATQRPETASCTVALSASKATIASRLSLTPEYFSRVLHELESAGLIAIHKREIRILDVQKLADYGSH
jgi:CRP-like cAMP-binding protein